MAITVRHCKQRLATVWFIGAGIVFLTVLVQVELNAYQGEVVQVWGWLLPTILPTLSLIIGVLVFDAMQPKQKAKHIDKFIFVLTASLSIVYLVAVLLVIVLQPFEKIPPVKAMIQANVWLGPFQGLVAAAMGAFFAKGAHEVAVGGSGQTPPQPETETAPAV